MAGKNTNKNIPDPMMEPGQDESLDFLMSDDLLGDEELARLLREEPEQTEPVRSAQEETYIPLEEEAPAAKPAPRRRHTLVWVLLTVALVIFATAGGLFWKFVGKPMLEQKRAEEYAAQLAAVHEMSGTMTAEELQEMDIYPNLERLDLEDSTCYEAILSYMKSHPQVKVTYKVTVAGKVVPGDTEELDLAAGTYTQSDLEENLRWLPRLRKLHLEDLQMPLDQVQTLQAAYPDVDLSYTVRVLNDLVPDSATELNLSAMTPAQVEQTVLALEKLPLLENIELMNGEGTSQLALSNVATLMDAVPLARVHYAFDFFGQSVSTEDEEIILQGVKMSESDEATVREALSVLKNCKRLVLDMPRYYRISHETMAGIREDFRDQTKVVWRIWFATYGSCLTDRQVIRFVYNLFDSNCSDLRYCEDAEYIDFGHNEFLTDCSWISTMTKLKAIILSGSSIKNLEPFATCESLEFLEIAYCSFIDDLTPLAKLPNLKMLNVSYTAVSDLSPIEDRGLELVMAVRSKVPKQERDRLLGLLPPEEEKPEALSEEAEGENAENTEATEAAEAAETTEATEATEAAEAAQTTEAAENTQAVETAAAEAAVEAQVEEPAEETQPEEPKVQTLYRFTGNEYGFPWRYEEDGRTKTPMYAKLCEVFHYPNASDTTW